MTGKTPFFVTGANCKIKVNGVTLAYATELSYSVVIAHQPAKVLGLYEADTIEPLSYGISGTFTVIRYVDGMTEAVKKAGGTPVKSSSRDGNGVGSFTINRGNNPLSVFGRATGNFTNDGRTNESLNPGALSRVLPFDIEIYQQVPKPKGQNILDKVGSSISRVTNDILDTVEGRNASINPFANNSEYGSVLGVSKLRDCKITGVVSNISKRGVMTQTFSFVANYLDEDSFISSPSGTGQQNS